MLTYINKKNKEVELTVTRHAYVQFVHRYPLIFKKKIENQNVIEEFEKIFMTASRVKNLKRKEQDRLKKYGQDSMYFRTHGFTFIVQNALIITVEISDKGKRYLNKCKYAKAS